MRFALYACTWLDAAHWLRWRVVIRAPYPTTETNHLPCAKPPARNFMIPGLFSFRSSRVDAFSPKDTPKSHVISFFKIYYAKPGISLPSSIWTWLLGIFRNWTGVPKASQSSQSSPLAAVCLRATNFPSTFRIFKWRSTISLYLAGLSSFETYDVPRSRANPGFPSSFS